MNIPTLYIGFHSVVSRMVDLNVREWQAFFDLLNFRKVPKKYRLTDVGEIAREAYFVNKGSIRIYYLKGDEEINGNFTFENGFTASFESFLLKTPSRLVVETVEDSELLVINKAGLDELTVEYPVFNLFSRAAAEFAFTTLQQRTVSLLLDSPEERYKNMLLERPNMLERIPQHMIASYLGVTPVSLSRIRKRISG